MSIKLELNKKLSHVNTYPCLMESKHTAAIILFRAHGNGTVLSGVGLGNKSTSWVMSNFKPYHGSITLTEV